MTEFPDLPLHVRLVALDGVAANPAMPLKDRLELALWAARQRRDLILEALEGHRKCLESPPLGHRCDLGKEIRGILGVADDE